MSFLSNVEFVVPLLRSLAKEKVEAKMLKVEAKVAAGMRSKGMTPDRKPLRDCVRDVIFRLWRQVIPSGDISDAIRDWQDDRVVPGVLAAVGSSPTLEALVTATREEILADLQQI